MWQANRKALSNCSGIHFQIMIDSRPATVSDVVKGWQTDKHFRDWFNTTLVDSPYSAFRWETPAATKSEDSYPFEFVLVDAPNLARQPDVEAFADYFTTSTSSIVSFQNLGRDAVMVVPKPMADFTVYGHLAAFVRHAPLEQRDALWQAVGQSMVDRLNEKPVWLSTAGAGVSWLHVRLDDRPKYYHYQPYC